MIFLSNWVRNNGDLLIICLIGIVIVSFFLILYYVYVKRVYKDKYDILYKRDEITADILNQSSNAIGKIPLISTISKKTGIDEGTLGAGVIVMIGGILFVLLLLLNKK